MDIPDSILNKLRDFHLEVNEFLLSYRNYSSTQFGYNINWNRESGFESTFHLMKPNDRDSLLIRLRAFSKKERFDLLAILDRLVECSSDKISARKLFGSLEYFFFGKNLTDTYYFVLDTPHGKIKTSEDWHNLLEKWLNAYVYHRDKSKQEFFSDIFKYVPKDFVVSHLLLIVSFKVNALFHLYNFVSMVLDPKHKVIKLG